MLDVDARTQRVHGAKLAMNPDTAVIPVVLTTQASTAPEALAEALKLHIELANALAPLVVPVIRQRGQRQKLLKTGVFGQGVRVTLEFEAHVEVPLSAGDLFARLERVESIRGDLHVRADTDNRLAIGVPRYELRDRSQARDRALAAFREELTAWEAAMGLPLKQVQPGELEVRVEGPDIAWVEIHGTAVLGS